MSSILNAEINDHRHAALMAEADMVRRARLARPLTAGDLRGPRGARAARRPMLALRAWIVAGQL